MILAANTSVTLDPAWPWSIPGIGLPALVGVAVVLLLLTVWTYVGARNSTGKRVLAILSLRLGALAIACFLVLRPSLAQEPDDEATPSRLILLIDKSASMNITDELNDSRWNRARQLLEASPVKSALKALAAEQRVEIVYYQGAEDISPFDPEGKADGKRTDMGQWLQALWTAHGRESRLRGVVLISDGADNGTRFPTLDKVALWRGTCPIFTFGVGRPTTTPRQNDIAFVQDKIFIDPNPVHVKGKLTAKAYVDAPGFENSKVQLGIFLNDKPAGPVEWVTLRKTRENEVKITCDAPVTPGEVKVTLKLLKTPGGEVTTANNEISTYATVIKEGVSVLWVEGKKRFESVFAIRYALSPDKRFRVFYTERLKGSAPPEGQADWYQFDKQHYDVIVIGDISAARFAEGDPGVFKKIRDLVEKKGTGLLMLGGYETFAAGWGGGAAPDVAAVLPVELNDREQIEGEGSVRVTPTEAGKAYMLRLDGNPQKNEDLWKTKFLPLDGMSKVGTPLPGISEVLARSGNDPVMVKRQAGQGRTLVFGGDTTWRAWRRNEEAIVGYQRFWKQVILWLAHQEEAEGNIRVIPDVRRVGADSSHGVGFRVEMVGKGGLPVKDARFQVKVIGPSNEEFEVATAPENGQERGIVRFRKEPAAGEYKIVASAAGSKEKPGEAKFLVYAEDIENLRPAADHDYLRKLAQAGRGKFAIADEQTFVQFLDELRGQQSDSTKPKAQLWPDWRRNPASDSFGDQLETLWGSSALACFILFAGFLCLEWFLRRRWGMV